MKASNKSAPAGSAGSSNPGEGDTGNASGNLAQARQTIVETAKETAADLKSAATDTATKAKASVEKMAQEKKENAARRIGGYGSAIHESAKSLEEKDPNIAFFTHRAADKLESVADYIRGRDFGSLKVDAEDLVRRHPAAFFGGMFVAGLVLGNVLKASQRASGSRRYESDDSDAGRGDDNDAMGEETYREGESIPSGQAGLET
jgi:hypothetical protein